MAARALTLAAAWLTTAAALFAFWLLLTDTVEAAQLYAGAVAAAIGASGSELVRAQRGGGMEPRARWLARIWRPLADVPADLAWLTLAVARAASGRGAPAGRFRSLPFDPGHGEPGDLAAHALAELAGSFAPNTVVVGIDAKCKQILVHQLLPPEDPDRAAATIDPLALG